MKVSRLRFLSSPAQPQFGSAIMDVWLPVTFAVNSLNRSMGIDDLYPFIVSPAVINKLRAVHQIVLHAGGR